MTMKDWALKYAGFGLAVFPLRPKDKRPATRNGCKDATTNKQQIIKWWDSCPEYNIGIAAGKPSGGLVVIDLDVSEKAWQKENGELPKTWTSATGRGGRHLLYRDKESRKNKVSLYKGIDIRGEGGYIVAPPSIHPNGSRYEWKQGPGDCEIAQADSKVEMFLLGPMPEERQAFSLPDVIPEGERTNALVRLVGSLKAKGLDDISIKAAVRGENGAKCVPPLTEQELEKTVFPAVSRWEPTAPYAVGAPERKQKNHSLDIVAMGDVTEKTPEWLVEDYIPKYQITTLAGAGGSGKTTVWCALAAAISSGRKTFLEDDLLERLIERKPGKVMFFSSEDSFEYTLKRRLRKNGANLDNIFSISISDERFQDIKFNGPFLERLLAKHRPVLVIFDPIQAFVPPEIRMGDRNAMRNCLDPLNAYGEKYGVTSLLVVHGNKLAGAWGRNRIADSADIWDISRSVIMAGETQENGVRYLSHEKSNLSRMGETLLYTIEDEIIVPQAYTYKKDRDFVAETNYASRQRPEKEEAKEFILDFLKDGKKEVSELDEMAAAAGISKNALKNAKAELRKEGKTRTDSVGFGVDRVFYISYSR